jgi:hypothetical protein
LHLNSDAAQATDSQSSLPSGNRELAARSGGSNGTSVGTLRKNAISARSSMLSGYRIFRAFETIGRVNYHVCEPVVFWIRTNDLTLGACLPVALLGARKEQAYSRG